MSDDDAPEAVPPERMRPAFGWFWAVVNVAIGSALLLHVAGVVRLDTRAGPVLLGVVGVLLLVVGAYFALMAVIDARRAGASPDASQLASIGRLSNVAGAVVLVGLATTLTIIATYAWLPEQRAAFSGGITGSVWEMRFVWAFAALVFDSIAIAALVLWWRGRR